MSSARIRFLAPGDAAGVLAVYAPYILNTHITFEYDVPSIEEFTDRVGSIAGEYPFLVGEVDGELVGYAYASRHRHRAAYDWSVESSVYVNEAFHGSGLARRLYEALFELLRLQGAVNVYAGIGLPNEKSVRFHERFGFTLIGDFKQIGYKFEKWHDVRWMHLALAAEPKNPQRLRSIEELRESEAVGEILRQVSSRSVERGG